MKSKAFFWVLSSLYLLSIFPSDPLMAQGVQHNPIWRQLDYTGFMTTYSLHGPAGIAVSTNGGVYVTGTVRENTSYARYDMLTVKYDNDGNKLWSNRLNSAYNSLWDTDHATGLAVDKNGNAAVSGALGFLNSNDVAFTVARYTSAGGEDWVDEYKEPGYPNNTAEYVITDSAGNIYACGMASTSINYSATQIILRKYNSAGTPQWTETYPAGPRFSPALALDTNGNLYVATQNNTGGNWECLLLKFNSSGTLLWDDSYSVNNDWRDRFDEVVIVGTNVYASGTITVQHDPDGHRIGLIRPGGFLDRDGNVYVNDGRYLVKMDPQSNELWRATHQLTYAVSGIVDGEGRVITGGRSSLHGNIYRIECFSSDGRRLWYDNYEPDTYVSSGGGCRFALDPRTHDYVYIQQDIRANLNAWMSAVKYDHDYFGAGLSVDKNVAERGDYLYYTNWVATGTSNQNNVILSCAVPSNTTHVSGGTLGLAGTNVTWTFPFMSSFTSTSVVLVVQVNSNVSMSEVLVNRSDAVSDSYTNPAASDSVTTFIYVPPTAQNWEETEYGTRQDIPESDDPVHPGIGNYVFNKSLFRLSERTLPVGLELTFNSKAADTPGPFGFGWTFFHNVTVTADRDTALYTIRHGDGHKEFFRRTSVGAIEPFNCYTYSELQTNSTGYRLILPNGIRYNFDTNGLLTSLTDLVSRQVALTYVSNRLDTITDVRSRQVVFDWTNGLVYRVRLGTPINRSVAFGYDSASNLTSMSDLRGHTWFFTYDDRHRVLTETDGRSILVNSNTYDSAGRVSAQRNANGDLTTYVYTTNDPSGWLKVSITPPGGFTVAQYYDSTYNCMKVVDGKGGAAQFMYDASGNRQALVDQRGEISTARYDDGGNRTSVINRAGHVTSMSYGPYGKVTNVTEAAGGATHLGYDNAGRVITVVNALGGTMTTTYDGYGRPFYIIDPCGAYWIMSYSGTTGDLLTRSGPDNKVVAYTYDEFARVRSMTTRGGAGTNWWWYDPNGNPTNLTDAMGRATVQTFDGNNNLISVTYCPTTATTTYAYNRLNQVTNIVDPLGGVSTFEYDTAGRLIRATDPDGVSVTKVYDERGQVLRLTDAGGHVTSYAYDAMGNPIAMTNHEGKVWRYAYDSRGHRVWTKAPDGGVETRAYDAAGRLTQTVDRVGRAVTRQFNVMGLITNEIASDGGCVAREYDAAARLTAVTDPLGHTWRFGYNVLGRLATNTNPKGESEYLFYDAMGSVTQKIARDGRVYVCTYNAEGSLTSARLPDGAGTVSNVYDAAGNLVEIRSPWGTSRMTYDKVGRKTSLTDVHTNTVGYTYTPGGRLQTVTYPGGHVVSNTYDNAGRLAGVSDWNSGQITIQYDTLDRITQLDLPNGTRRKLSYDDVDRVVGIRHEKNDTTLIQQYEQSFNAVGQVTNRVRETEGVLGDLSSMTSTSSYDVINRLATVVRNGSTNLYWYDGRGNLVSNRVNGTVAIFMYDAADRLIKMTDGSMVLSNRYDGRGERVAKKVDGLETRYLTDDGRIYCELDAGNNPTRYYVYAGQLAYCIDGASLRQVYHADPLGSVEGITDSGENLVQSYAYAPYGERTGSVGSETNAFCYIGAYGVTAEENGLYRMGARHYDPETGRFLCQDPLGLSAGLNLYEYAHSDPVNEMDPEGLDARLGESIPFGEGFKKVFKPQQPPTMQTLISQAEDYIYVPEQTPNHAYPASTAPASGPYIRSYTRSVTPGKEIAVYNGPPTKEIAVYDPGKVNYTPNASPPPAGFVQSSLRGGGNYLRRVYAAIRKDVRLWATGVGVQLMYLKMIGDMPVVFIVTRGGAAIAGSTVAVLTIEGVVVYVVTEEVGDMTGVNEGFQDGFAVLWADWCTEDNLIDRRQAEQSAWKRIQRLNQKVEGLDALYEELENTPGFEGFMTLECPYY